MMSETMRKREDIMKETDPLVTGKSEELYSGEIKMRMIVKGTHI